MERRERKKEKKGEKTAAGEKGRHQPCGGINCLGKTSDSSDEARFNESIEAEVNGRPGEELEDASASRRDAADDE